MENFTLWRTVEKVLFLCEKARGLYSLKEHLCFLLFYVTLIERNHILVVADFMFNFRNFKFRCCVFKKNTL